MKLKVFTLQFNPEAGCFPDAELTGFGEENELLSVTEQFFTHQGLPFLGFRVFPSLIRLRAESLWRLRRKLKRRRCDFQAGGMTEAAFLDSTRSLIGHVLQANTRNLRNDLIGSCGLLTVNDC